jgi:thiol-disulfide isomerase/thioredoxin
MMFISIGIGTVIAVVMIVVVSVLTGGKVTSNTSSGLPTSALVGHPVASFSLPGLNGGTVAAPWKSHHASALIFFASWCGPCQMEMPEVASYVRTHQLGSVEVVGIDANDAQSSGAAFIKKSGVSFPVGFDANGNITSGEFGFAQLPETVFVNGRGTVTSVYFGAIPTTTLARQLHRLA